ncbi:hypothetical protein M0R45_035097 [Rubus argutus]|uniref:Uncharacterized protein n=1 Tax=Rubus argutus TaxID=59490 RepID=A0AAW1VTN9_RUBAR
MVIGNRIVGVITDARLRLCEGDEEDEAAAGCGCKEAQRLSSAQIGLGGEMVIGFFWAAGELSDCDGLCGREGKGTVVFHGWEALMKLAASLKKQKKIGAREKAAKQSGARAGVVWGLIEDRLEQ